MLLLLVRLLLIVMMQGGGTRLRRGGSRGRSCGLDRWFDIVNLYELLDGY